MKIVYVILVFSIASNILLLVLYLHSRCSYRKLMQKSLRQAEPEEKLVETVVFDDTEVISEQDQDLLRKLRTCLEEEKIYLSPELGIQDLAKAVGTNKTTLSHIINAHLHQNFASLLNGYRVKESIRLLSDPQYFNEKMEVVAEMCGYNNRQVFHAAFKKEMGITPNHFRNIQKTTAREEKRNAQGDDARTGVEPS